MAREKVVVPFFAPHPPHSAISCAPNASKANRSTRNGCGGSARAGSSLEQQRQWIVAPPRRRSMASCSLGQAGTRGQPPQPAHARPASTSTTTRAEEATRPSIIFCSSVLHGGRPGPLHPPRREGDLARSGSPCQPILLRRPHKQPMQSDLRSRLPS